MALPQPDLHVYLPMEHHAVLKAMAQARGTNARQLAKELLMRAIEAEARTARVIAEACTEAGFTRFSRVRAGFHRIDEDDAGDEEGNA
jgi:hypothetical protein